MSDGWVAGGPIPPIWEQEFDRLGNPLKPWPEEVSMSDGTPETIPPADREAERLKAAYEDGCEDMRRRIEGKHRVSSPASEPRVIPAQTDSLWREVGELKRRLAGLERTNPLAAAERRSAEIVALAVRLERLLGVVQAAEAVSASDAAKLLTRLEELLAALQVSAEWLSAALGPLPAKDLCHEERGG
jgi:hypothetical protein